MHPAPVRVIALHGFLGRASDWDALGPWLPWAEIDAVDLWAIADAAADDDPWASIGLLLERELGRRIPPGAPTIVVAYSFGARLTLAVEALAGGRLPVAGVCLVSCNPGLADDDLHARARRLADDEAWAERFERSDEEEIRRAWEAQPVLAAARRAPVSRAGWTLPASRATLAAAMRRFSLARQPDRRPRLHGWATPLLWVTGEEDRKFGGIARNLQAAGVPARFAECPRAGHRVPWDSPEGFAGILAAWNVE
ncbi:MAG TPA: alpha/beta fold hydrolase [Vicinamibacterales bacterium]|nr:alpha/beta fold hydrolase [Vicinamibacterales bacterium]